LNDAGATPATSLYPSPEGRERPLRVVLVGPPQVPEWVRAFHELAAGHAWIEMVALATAEAVLPAISGVGADMRAFIAYERALLGHRGGLAPVEIPGAPGEAHGMALPARVGALAPDLVILLGPQAWASALAGQAPRGCWHVDASLTDPLYAGLALLAPMMRGETATQVELMLHEPGRAPVALAGSWGRTRRISFLMQRNDAFRKLPALLLRALHRAAAVEAAATRGSVATLQLQSRPLGRAAGLRALLSTLRATARSLQTRFGEPLAWTLMLRQGTAMLDPEAPVVGPHVRLKSPKGWWADPFLVQADGRTLLFVEEMADPESHKANIVCVELVDGAALRLGIALDEPGHLSFPQPFLWEGQWYMTIETGYDRRVSLYRATEFPMQWARARDLVTGRVCVDPTLHHFDGHWYLFTNIAESGNNTCDELFLFVADSLEGPFTPHPVAPIVSDVRRARMAGRLFRHHGRLIRPAQDCAPGYGRAVVFNEVLELGPTTYRERTLSRFAPHWGPALDGCHTYNRDGAIEVLDAYGRPPADAACLQVSDAAATAIADGPADPAGDADPAVAGPESGTGTRPPQPTSIGTHYLRYSTTNVLVMLAGFISFPLLTRLLDHAQFGILKYYDSWLLVTVALVKFGAQHAVVRFYPYDGDPQHMRSFGTNLVLVPIGLSTLLWALMASVLTTWQWWRGAEFNPVFWCVVLITPLVAIGNIIQMVVRASERSDVVMATRVAGRWLELALVVAFVVVLQHSALAVYGGKIVAAVVVLAWLLHWMRRNLHFARGSFDPGAFRAGLVYGLPMMTNELAAVALAVIDRVMLKGLTGDFSIVGIYAIGYALATQLNVFIDATLSEAFVPVVNRTYENGGNREVRALKARVLLPMTYVVVAIVAMLVIAGPDLLVALSGPDKAASGNVFVLVGITLALFALFDIANYGLLLKKRAMTQFLLTLAAALLNIALNFLLIPRMGYIGAAWATAISYAALAIARFVACPEGLTRFPDSRTVMLSLGCAVLLVAVARGSDLFGMQGPWLRLLVSGALFGLLYALPVLVLDRRARSMLLGLRTPAR
jgi:O-antigen/teichoic acid export membrane protein